MQHEMKIFNAMYKLDYVNRFLPHRNLNLCNLDSMQNEIPSLKIVKFDKIH